MVQFVLGAILGAVVSFVITSRVRPGKLRHSITMTKESIDHLDNVETAIRSAKLLLARDGYPDNLRTVVVIGFLDQMVEHHGAMLLLIRNGQVGSAFALARSIVESMFRGLWINLPATDPEIAAFERDDEIPLRMPALSQAIDQAYGAGDLFEDLKNRGWAALCSYTHTGILQLGRRFTGHNVQPAYNEAEIFEVTTTATTCILLLVGRFLIVQGHASLGQEADRLIETYGPVARRA
jgi:hypothetical protein